MQLISTIHHQFRYDLCETSNCLAHCLRCGLADEGYIADHEHTGACVSCDRFYIIFHRLSAFCGLELKPPNRRLLRQGQAEVKSVCARHGIPSTIAGMSKLIADAGEVPLKKSANKAAVFNKLKETCMIWRIESEQQVATHVKEHRCRSWKLNATPLNGLQWTTTRKRNMTSWRSMPPRSTRRWSGRLTTANSKCQRSWIPRRLQANSASGTRNGKLPSRRHFLVIEISSFDKNWAEVHAHLKHRELSITVEDEHEEGACLINYAKKYGTRCGFEDKNRVGRTADTRVKSMKTSIRDIWEVALKRRVASPWYTVPVFFTCKISFVPFAVCVPNFKAIGGHPCR